MNRIGFPAWIWGLIFIIAGCQAAVKIRYVSNTECDRYTVDAVYYEKYKLVTDNIFKDSIEFVNKVSDSVAESLTATMADLPDRDSSDNQERRVYEQFKSIKKAYSSRVKKAQKNITSKWDDLVASSFELLYDSGKSSLAEYLNKTLNMTEAYSEARKSLDSSMGSFISFVKSIVRDGLQGITLAATEALKKDDADKTNSTKEEKEEKPEDKLMKKKLEITEMVVSGFLRKVTVEVIKQKIDLFKKITIKPEDRDSVLDDMLFDLLMIKNRMLALIHEDIPKEKGSIDLARRSIYTYWAEQAEEMYKEKLKSKQSTSPGGELYYKKLWSDEKELIDTLLNLMESYP